MGLIRPENVNFENGKQVILRSCEPKDAREFVKFAMAVGQQTPFTRFSSGVKPDEEETAREWQRDLERSDVLHLGAFVDGRMIGYLKFRQQYPDHFGFKHIADFGVMILSEGWGQGLGLAFMRAMESYAKSIGVHRIEARIRQGNERAFSFFKALKYEIEGTRKNSVKIDDTFLDEFYIAKLI